MTEQTAQTPKRVVFTPDEWKNTCIFNLQQLANYLSSIPAHVESGAAGLGPEQLALIDMHLERGRSFLRAWSVARVDVPKAAEAAAQVQAAPDPAPAQERAAANAPKPRKGGWPRGKPRKPKVEQPVAAK